MGKAVPSLSKELRNQRSVRKALRPSGHGTTWMLGHAGAQRAARRLGSVRAASLARARPLAPPATWEDIPLHVQRGVLWRLSLGDLEACRLAGFGGSEPAWRAVLRTSFLDRVRALGRVERAYVFPGNVRRGLANVTVADGAALRYRPVQFSCMDKLFVFTSGGGAGVAPRVPEGIGEMRVLERLEVLGDVVNSLPTGIVMCEGLRQLGLRGHGFIQLPAVVLGMKRLRILTLSMCSTLERLPRDIGEKLPELSKLEIEGCSALKVLPDSLLDKLERSGYNVPLVLTPLTFRAGYLDSYFCPNRFPRLRRKMAAAYPDAGISAGKFLRSGVLKWNLQPRHYWVIQVSFTNLQRCFEFG